MIFTAGAPGSGKTYCLHSIYGLDNVTMIDLDSEMKYHPNYVDRGNNSHLYEAKASYKWADEMVEKSFPESKGGALAVDPTIEENKETLKRKREEEVSSLTSTSSSSSSSSSAKYFRKS